MVVESAVGAMVTCHLLYHTLDGDLLTHYRNFVLFDLQYRIPKAPHGPYLHKLD